MTHAFPRLEWTPCNERPDNCRRVMVWHRCRPWCRFYRVIVGWWNSREWRWDYCGLRSEHDHGIIYQPAFWKDIELPK